MANTRVLIVLSAALAAFACGRTDPADWRISVQPLAIAAGPNTSEPQLSQSSRGVLVSWLEHAGPMMHLKFAERTASGWSEPKTAASGEGWFRSYADVPSVMRMSDGTLVAQWLEITEEFLEAYNLRLSYSKDDGRTWAPPFMPHHDGTMTQHGFASLFELPGRALGLVWLDGRAVELDASNPEGGAMSLRYAAFDANWKQTADMPIDLRVCECCPTTAVVTPDGVLTAYRDRSDKEIRDISISRLENGAWTTPAAVHADNWDIPACPVNGPMMAGRGREVAAAWFTVKNDEGQSYAAFSSDSGRTWGTPIRLDDAGSLGRVDIELLDDGSAVASWVEFADRRAQFRVRRVDATGAKSAPITVAGVDGGRASGYPRVARAGNELVFAWSESTPGSGEGEPVLQLKTAVATLP
jgi:hypothetical protein